VYCAVVLDAYSRRVVGWSIDAAPTAALVTNALSRAIDTRRPAGSTVIHRDQGTQDGSWAFTRRAQEAGLLPAMAAVGTCFDWPPCPCIDPSTGDGVPSCRYRPGRVT
jgi:putative transposase